MPARNRKPWSIRAFVAGLLALLLIANVARADVVPPEAVALADDWFLLIDRGRVDEAVRKWFVATPARTATDLRQALKRPEHARGAASPILRTIHAWRGHGPGDTSRVAPGGWFSLVYRTIDADGRVAFDELRLIPRDGGWRLVDDRESTTEP